MIAYNAAAQLAGLFGTALLQAFFGIIAARFLGVEDFGKFAFAWAITQILVASGDLGLHNTAIRRISSDPDQSPDLFSGFYSLKLLLSAGLLAVMLLLVFVIGDSTEMRLALLLFGLGTVAHSTNLSLNIAFQAHGKLYLASLNGVLISAFQFVFGIGLLLSGGKLISLGLAYALATSLALVINYRTFERKVHRAELGGTSYWREMIRESLPVGLGSLFYTTSSKVPITLLPILANNFQTGLFSAAFRVTSVLANIPVAILSAVLPVMASLQGDRRKVRSLLAKSSLWMAASSLILTLLLLHFSTELVVFLFGQDYSASGEILAILSWSLPPIFVGMAFSNVILSQRELIRFFPVVRGISALVAVVASLLLIAAMESYGAALASLILETVLAVLCIAASARFLLTGSRSTKKPGIQQDDAQGSETGFSKSSSDP